MLRRLLDGRLTRPSGFDNIVDMRTVFSCFAFLTPLARRFSGDLPCRVFVEGFYSNQPKSAFITASTAACGVRSCAACLPMTFAEYLKLLDWTGRQLRADKCGAIPQDLAPILERLQIGGPAGWLQLMGQFSRLFRRAAGRPQSL